MQEGDPVLDRSLSAFEKAALGNDCYVFYENTSDKVTLFEKNQTQNPEFRFFADVERCTEERPPWRWTAFAIIQVGDMLDLSTAANRIVAPPDPVHETAKPVKYGARVMRRSKHYKYFGFARLRVERRRLDEVLLAINDDTPGYSGSAAVNGRFNIIVELGADVPEEVCRRLEALPDVSSAITDVEAARVTGLRYFYDGAMREVGVAEPD